MNSVSHDLRAVVSWRSVPKILLVAASSVGIGAYSLLTLAQDVLGKADATALITGNTVHFKNLSNGHSGRVYHDKSGEIAFDRDDGVTFSGLWSVQANGKRCHIVQNELCGPIRRNADGTYTWQVDGGDTVLWTRITPGKAF
jgi:hypothetical protein